MKKRSGVDRTRAILAKEERAERLVGRSIQTHAERMAEAKRKRELEKLGKETQLFTAQAKRAEAKVRRARGGKKKTRRPSVRRTLNKMERGLNPYASRKHRSIFDW